MLFGARGPYGTQPARPNRLRALLIAFGILILVLFIVDKVILTPPAPPPATSVATVIDRLNRHEVRRVTVPARSVTVELNDGTSLTTTVPAERDLWPAIRRSGADVTIVPAAARESDTSPIGYAFSFVPFIIMAVLLLYILRNARRARPL